MVVKLADDVGGDGLGGRRELLIYCGISSANRGCVPEHVEHSSNLSVTPLLASVTSLLASVALLLAFQNSGTIKGLHLMYQIPEFWNHQGSTFHVSNSRILEPSRVCILILNMNMM